MTFSIHATKHGETVETIRISRTIAHAKASALVKAGWQVHVTDSEGRVFHPEKFDELLRFDRKPQIRF